MASTSAARPPSAKKESRNWLEMPHELMANILERLGAKEILKNARKVCTTWRIICKDPAIWKTIVMHQSFDVCDRSYNFEMMTKQAVDLSCGELMNISMEDFGDDDLLEHIVIRSKKLKHLSLVRCLGITDSMLSLAAVKGLPHLEKLQLHETLISPKTIEVFGRNCPHLKSLILGNMFRGLLVKSDDYAFAIANSMPELRRLELNDGEMTNDGLQAILDGCSHLQSLDVSWSFRLNLNGDLGKMCRERIKDFKHFSIEDHLDEGDLYEELYEDDLYEGDFYEGWIL